MYSLVRSFSICARTDAKQSLLLGERIDRCLDSILFE
jgi:hypothetical protein